MAFSIASVLQQEDVEPTVTKQSLSVVQSMSNVTRIPMKVQHGGNFGSYTRGLFNKVPNDLCSIFGREIDTLVGETDRAGGLNEHTSTLWLFGIVDKGVLVVVEPTNHSYDE